MFESTIIFCISRQENMVLYQNFREEVISKKTDGFPHYFVKLTNKAYITSCRTKRYVFIRFI